MTNIEAEVAVRAFLEEMEGPEWDAPQIERLMSRLTPDAQYHVVAWLDPIVGADAIRVELVRQAPRFRDIQIEILAIASVGRLVFTERLDSMTMTGAKFETFHVATVFEVDESGKIADWRDYVDSREVAVKTRGTDRERG